MINLEIAEETKRLFLEGYSFNEALKKAKMLYSLDKNRKE